jgi:hypothetical protein
VLRISVKELLHSRSSEKKRLKNAVPFYFTATIKHDLEAIAPHLLIFLKIRLCESPDKTLTFDPIKAAD